MAVRQIARLRDAYNYSVMVYRYRCIVLGENTLISLKKIVIFIQVLNRVFLQRKRIFCYPETPDHVFVLFKILLFLGYRATSDPSKFCRIAIKWRQLYDGNPYFPPEPVLEELTHTLPGAAFLNMRCNDVSKERVSAVFEETFGYSVSIDPQTYTGKCVMKSNWNGLHIGEIIECPSPTRRPNFVYEKLIDNEVEGGFVEDVRVPIFNGTIPFVYLKYRPITSRLVDREHSNKQVVIAEVQERLSQEEVRKIIQFCERIGLDYGEIDVLRNGKGGEIYIVEVNTNPSGPPQPISEGNAHIAIVRLARTFEQTFGTNRSNAKL